MQYLNSAAATKSILYFTTMYASLTSLKYAFNDEISDFILLLTMKLNRFWLFYYYKTFAFNNI